jgi:hypothetical protein
VFLLYIPPASSVLSHIYFLLMHARHTVAINALGSLANTWIPIHHKMHVSTALIVSGRNG